MKGPAENPTPDGKSAKWWDIEVRPSRRLTSSEVARLERLAPHLFGGFIGVDGLVGSIAEKWPGSDAVARILAAFRGLSGRYRVGYAGQHCAGAPACASVPPGRETCFVASNADCCPPDLGRVEWMTFGGTGG